MVTVSRKQREIQLRESQILKAARPILLREGYQGLTMERLASLMEYAKGTLYNHFPNKEEIVLALAVESMELRYRLFDWSAKSCDASRERLMAVGAACEYYTRQYADHFAIEHWIRNTTIWDKSSSQRQALILQCESRCMSVVSAIVEDAVKARDLKLPNGLSAAEMIFGFWAINYGSQVLAATSPSLASLGIADGAKTIRHHCHTLMNGFGWQPLLDYSQHDARMDQLVADLTKQFPRNE